MELKVDLFELVMAFSRMLDRVMPQIAEHHQRVAYFVDKVGNHLSLPPLLQHKALLAALLHDVGALPLRVSADDLIFERDREGHAAAGAKLLHRCAPLSDLAPVVKDHHIRWREVDPEDTDQRLASLINLADRVDVFLRVVPPSPSRMKRLREHFRQTTSTIFAPLHVEALFDTLREPEIVHCLSSNEELAPARPETVTPMSAECARKFVQFFGHVIDSRSPFTATHSAGVARLGCDLGKLSGMNAADLDTMFMAGMLHDIGKLDIPLSILEKNGSLDRDEAAIIRSHAQLSEQWLSAIPGFEQITRWGALHHERLNGSGYPHGYVKADLEVPSRIMAVADVFTAITEDRPYRVGMSLTRALEVLNGMSGYHLDEDLVRLACQNAAYLDERRREAQAEAQDLYTFCKAPLF